MTQIHKQIVIEASQNTVWEKLSNLGAIQDFNPGVKKSYYNTSAKAGEGAGRVCEFHGMGIVNETAVAWKEGESFTLRILPVEKIPFFKSGEAQFTLKNLGNNNTEVTAIFHYAVKAGIVPKLMNSMAMKSQFAKGFEGILKGLKRHLEEGVLIHTGKDLKGYEVELVA